ncbi:MAG: hypothetical protein WDN28_12095 [Chthoniobacter sp.]
MTISTCELVSMGFGMIRRGPWLHQYFVGWPYTHGQPEIWERDPATREAWYGREKGGIYCATQRVDGFLSMDAPNSGGTLTTRPMTFQGDRLRLNVHTTVAAARAWLCSIWKGGRWRPLRRKTVR